MHESRFHHHIPIQPSTARFNSQFGRWVTPSRSSMMSISSLSRPNRHIIMMWRTSASSSEQQPPDPSQNKPSREHRNNQNRRKLEHSYFIALISPIHTLAIPSSLSLHKIKREL